MTDKEWMENLKDMDLTCIVFRQEQTPGILLTPYPVTVTYHNESMVGADKNWYTPSAVLYSSDDGEITMQGALNENHYIQHSTTRSDAYGIKEIAADYMYESYHLPEWNTWEEWMHLNCEGTTCTITAVRYDQYILVRMENAGIVISSTTTLGEEYRDKDVFLSVTGECCVLSDFTIKREPDAIEEGTITPVKYRKTDLTEIVGDIPNVDCVGWWTAHSDGIEIGEEPIRIKYNTISYQQAVENWHTPLMVFFSSLNQSVGGMIYNEFCVVRTDGYGWNIGADALEFSSEFQESGVDYPTWLSKNKSGVRDCEIEVVRIDDTVIVTNVNSGLKVKASIRIPLSNALPVCLSLSGELCTISNIRIER